MTALHRDEKYLHEEIKELRELLRDWDKQPPTRAEMASIEKEIVGRKFTNREREVELRKLMSPLIMEGLYINAKWDLMNGKERHF